MSNHEKGTPHIPVLLRPVLDGLNIRSGGIIVDGTVGAGGHAAAILDSVPDVRLFGFDRDPRSLAIAQERLADYGERATLIHSNYDGLTRILEERGIFHIDGVLLDLGISSMHVDEAERGFTFKNDAPLDMRFDPSENHQSAADMVNTYDADELANILYEYGEEPQSRAIARAIVAARPLTSTRQLAEVIAKAHRGPREKIHPATRAFQALRIAVNDELGALERVLPQTISLLNPGGRLAVISFHSLEDRIVKNFMRNAATDCICLPKQPVCTCGHTASITLITRKPITADEQEIAANPRSRSAKLRVAEKL